MRKLFILIFTIIIAAHFYSCSTTTKYLSHNEIVNQMNDDASKPEEKSSMDLEEMERRSNLIPLEDFFGEKLKDIKEKKEKERIAMKSESSKQDRSGADYRYRDTPVKSQWNGTCTAFGGVAGLENLLNKPETLDLSERDAWSKYRQFSASSFVTTLSKKGNEICREVDWNQNNIYASASCASNRKWRLGESQYISDNIASALDALDKGYVVYLGMSTPNDMLNCRSVIRTTSSFSRGGHAILIVGYKMDSTITGGGYFIIKNSWGANCGDYGYQYLPFYMCQRNDGYCVMWEFRSVVDNTDGIIPEPVLPEYKWVQQCRKVWYTLWVRQVCSWVQIRVN